MAIDHTNFCVKERIKAQAHPKPKMSKSENQSYINKLKGRAWQRNSTMTNRFGTCLNNNNANAIVNHLSDAIAVEIQIHVFTLESPSYVARIIAKTSDLVYDHVADSLTIKCLMFDVEFENSYSQI